MARKYRLGERAKVQDETRERIIRATMALHDEHGVVATSLVDVAKRAGVGAATVYRHFPTTGSLVMACGSHVWAEMSPPVPEQAAEVFEGVERTEARLARLAEELDAFYRRGALRLGKAIADRERVPELDEFLRAVEAGVAALVREAVRNERLPDVSLRVLDALAVFPVWASIERVEFAAPDRTELVVRIMTAAIEATR